MDRRYIALLTALVLASYLFITKDNTDSSPNTITEIEPETGSNETPRTSGESPIPLSNSNHFRNKTGAINDPSQANERMHDHTKTPEYQQIDPSHSSKNKEDGRSNRNNEPQENQILEPETDTLNSENGTKPRYLKIDHLGNPLPDSANSWSCIFDTDTQLLWEIKNPSLQGFSQEFTYRWDDAPLLSSSTDPNSIEEINKCPYFSGRGNSNESCTANTFKAATNLMTLCGSNKWDIPTVSELQSIVVSGKYQPALDERYFPDGKNDFYWSNEGFAYSEFNAWAMNFSIGKVNDVPKNKFIYVRLVTRGLLFSNK